MTSPQHTHHGPGVVNNMYNACLRWEAIPLYLKQVLYFPVKEELHIDAKSNACVWSIA